MSLHTQERHPAEDALELYCLGRLEEDAAAGVEEHLLICEACQARALELDSFLRAARSATAELRQEARYREQPSRGWMAWLGRPMWAAAAMAAVVIVVGLPTLRRATDPVAVELSAFRGGADPTGSGVAPAGRPLTLSLDLTGLDSSECRTIVVVDAEGAKVSEGAAEIVDDKAILRTKRGFSGGQYWVRIFDANGNLLRETGLRTE
jgi:hypothetical protein